MSNAPIRFAYFGSSKVSIYVLEELAKAGFVPELIITTPDKPQGRGLKMTQNMVKVWAEEHGIKAIDPANFGNAEKISLTVGNYDVFIVASYGKILPADIVNMPRNKTLNVHPSLLPRYRGAAPLPATILEDTKDTGVTIMRMDEQVDHGPIIAKKAVTIPEWPTYEEFEEMMAREGGKLLASILPDWVGGRIKEVEQDHSKATFTKKIKKENALLDLSADSYANFRKIQAYHEWPQAYFFADKNGKDIRVKVTEATFADGELKIQKVIPEGSKEMAYKDFLTGYKLKD